MGSSYRRPPTPSGASAGGKRPYPMLVQTIAKFPTFVHIVRSITQQVTLGANSPRWLHPHDNTWRATRDDIGLRPPHLPGLLPFASLVSVFVGCRARPPRP